MASSSSTNYIHNQMDSEPERVDGCSLHMDIGDDGTPRETPTHVESNNDGLEMEADFSENVGSTEKETHKSEVWKHFERVVRADGQVAICVHCKSTLKAPPSYGTSHLKKHYKKTCKRRPGRTDIKQILLMGNKKASGSQDLSTHSFTQESTRAELASMVILHEYPLRMVDHLGFRRYSASLNPCFKMISRNTLKKDILKVYDDERSKCYKLLEKFKCRVSITTDMWTSNDGRKGYMAVTGHFIDDSWVLRNVILRFAYVEAPHTAERLSDALVESFMDWNIDRKLMAITVDNCSTNDAMLRILLEKLPKKDLPLNGKALHMRCCAHILNLIVKDGMDTISGAIERIRDSDIYWTTNPARYEKFEEASRQLNIDCTKKLCLDCKTRWNSTYLMLDTAIVYRDVFPRVKLRERNYKNVPTEEDWENAIEICSKLKVFYVVTEMFSGTLYPTSNFYFPKICDMKLRLEEWAKSSNEMIKKMAEKMLEKYDKYWKSCHILMGIATVLDPRYKMKLVEFYFTKIYGKEARSKIDEVRSNCCELLLFYQSKGQENNSTGASSSSGMITTPLTTIDENDSLEMYDQFVAEESQYTSASFTELDLYLEESVLPRSQHFDILSWWKTTGVKYHTLQKMAKDILAVPISTVASESAFSGSGRLLSKHCSRLNETTLEALMCSRRWLWSDFEGTPPSMLDEEEDDDDDVSEC